MFAALGFSFYPHAFLFAVNLQKTRTTRRIRNFLKITTRGGTPRSRCLACFQRE